MKNALILCLLIFSVSQLMAQVGIGTVSPNSTLDVRGSFAAAYRSFTTSTTATATDYTLVFTGTTASTATLPDATACAGRAYLVKNASTTFPVPLLTINTTSSQTIDGITSWLLDQKYESAVVVSNGTNWQVLAQDASAASAGTNWNLGGNSVASLQNFGTISNFDIPFIVDNIEKMRLSTTGNLGLGTSTFNGTYPEKFIVDAGTTTSVNAIVGKGNINNYLQLNIQNINAGLNASSDVVATADNGSETTNFVDMGINSSVNTQGIMGLANDAYLYNIGQNFLLGTGTTSKSLVFMTGGTTQSVNERMRIDGSGNVGIGITNPAYKLHVISSANPLFLGGVQTGLSSDSLLTIVNGVVRKLSPSALTTSSSNAWALIGNASTNPLVNFLGTTDAQPLLIKTNSVQVGRFDVNALALGIGATINNSTHSYAIGTNAYVGFNHTNAYAFGTGATVNTNNSLSLGDSSVTNGSNSLAIGNNAAANSVNAVAIGPNAYTAYSVTDAIAIGDNATANAPNSIAIGSHSTLGSKTVTNAASAIAIGTTATANSANAISIGTGSLVGYSLNPAIAIGNAAVTNGNNGISIGNGANISFLTNAMALGAGASASSTANYSTALGTNASATLPNEIILGDRANSSLSVGIGTETFSGTNREKFLVDLGITSSVNAIVGRGNLNNYLQLNIQNMNAGLNASSDVVATADNGNETTNFVDMGINSSVNTQGIMGLFNDAYLYNMGQNFLLGTGTAAKSLVFMTGGTTQATNERMRIDGSGNVGIGSIAPSQKLDINGNLRLSGAFMPGNTAGTPGTFLTSSGAGVAPTWIDPSSYLSAIAWELGGNATSSVQGIGTTSNFDLPFITNNVEKMRLTSTGSLGVGTSTISATFPEKLIVDAGATGNANYQNVIVGKGNTNSYAQLNIQNGSTGTGASSDVVATANDGNESINFIDMGINGGGNTSTGVLGGANTAYLYATGNDFVIGNSTNDKSLLFYTSTANISTERMRVTTAGLMPGADNAYTLGKTGSRWSALWSVNGTIQTSDRRLKTNILPLQYGLKDVMAMEPVRYNWKENPTMQKIGLIAQDVKKIIPEVVTGNENKEMLGMNYSELVPVLINAIKEQQKEIEDLKKAMTDMKKTICNSK